MLSRFLTTFSLLILMSATVLAAAPVDPLDGPDFLLNSLPDTGKLSDSLKPGDTSLQNSELSLTYNPKDYEGVTDNSGNKAQLLESLKSEMSKKTDPNILNIPKAPADLIQLEKLSELSEADIQSFLGKKQKFLERVAKVLTFFHLKPKSVNKVLVEMNNKFYASSRLIAKSNSVGATWMVSTSAGIALPRKIVEKLQGRALGKWIPKSGGFLYLIGGGIGFSRQVTAEGKPNWVLDVFVDVESLKHTFTGVAEVGVGTSIGAVYELREDSFKTQKTENFYGGLAGVFRQGETQFGWSGSLGIGLPPGVGSMMAFTNNSKRAYIFRINFTSARERTADLMNSIFSAWLGKVKSKKGVALCSEAFL